MFREKVPRCVENENGNTEGRCQLIPLSWVEMTRGRRKFCKQGDRGGGEK